MLVLSVCALIAFAAIWFHWLRIAACGIGLLLWAVGNFILPYYFACGALLDGDGFFALVSFALGGLSGAMWLAAAAAAFEWTRREGTTGHLWRDWYAH